MGAAENDVDVRVGAGPHASAGFDTNLELDLFASERTRLNHLGAAHRGGALVDLRAEVRQRVVVVRVSGLRVKEALARVADTEGRRAIVCHNVIQMDHCDIKPLFGPCLEVKRGM